MKKLFKLKFKNLAFDPIECGRLSSFTNTETNEEAVVDAYLNNTYSEQEFIDELFDVLALSHDAFYEAADEMNVDVKEVRVYDARFQLTNRTIADYIESDLSLINRDYDFIDDEDYE
jgi:hypothetical protein